MARFTSLGHIVTFVAAGLDVNGPVFTALILMNTTLFDVEKAIGIFYTKDFNKAAALKRVNDYIDIAYLDAVYKYNKEQQDFVDTITTHIVYVLLIKTLAYETGDKDIIQQAKLFCWDVLMSNKSVSMSLGLENISLVGGARPPGESIEARRARLAAKPRAPAAPAAPAAPVVPSAVNRHATQMRELQNREEASIQQLQRLAAISRVHMAQQAVQQHDAIIEAALREPSILDYFTWKTLGVIAASGAGFVFWLTNNGATVGPAVGVVVQAIKGELNAPDNQNAIVIAAITDLQTLWLSARIQLRSSIVAAASAAADPTLSYYPYYENRKQLISLAFVEFENQIARNILGQRTTRNSEMTQKIRTESPKIWGTDKTQLIINLAKNQAEAIYTNIERYRSTTNLIKDIQTKARTIVSEVNKPNVSKLAALVKIDQVSVPTKGGARPGSGAAKKGKEESNNSENNAEEEEDPLSQAIARAQKAASALVAGKSEKTVNARHSGDTTVKAINGIVALLQAVIGGMKASNNASRARLNAYKGVLREQSEEILTKWEEEKDTYLVEINRLIEIEKERNANQRELGITLCKGVAAVALGFYGGGLISLTGISSTAATKIACLMAVSLGKSAATNMGLNENMIQGLGNIIEEDVSERIKQDKSSANKIKKAQQTFGKKEPTVQDLVDKTGLNEAVVGRVLGLMKKGLLSLANDEEKEEEAKPSAKGKPAAAKAAREAKAAGEEKATTKSVAPLVRPRRGQQAAAPAKPTAEEAIARARAAKAARESKPNRNQGGSRKIRYRGGNRKTRRTSKTRRNRKVNRATRRW
uniref:Uncharacterized protein n=1 Tax=viral metagenome TaxID=1070528 RepID=A0A6C0KWP8_9ZZZZ